LKSIQKVRGDNLKRDTPKFLKLR